MSLLRSLIFGGKDSGKSSQNSGNGSVIGSQQSVDFPVDSEVETDNDLTSGLGKRIIRGGRINLTGNQPFEYENSPYHTIQRHGNRLKATKTIDQIPVFENNKRFADDSLIGSSFLALGNPRVLYIAYLRDLWAKLSFVEGDESGAIQVKLY